MNNLFFTSDHHFGHENIIRYCNRPFKNADEMNTELIKRWNEKIPEDADVYHLGDFALCPPDQLDEILRQLNGRIHLIIGNHENAALNAKRGFKWKKEYFELKVEDAECKNGVQRIVLFHYAMRVWRSSFRGTWHLYGHSHGTLPDLENSLSFDIGVDSHNFYPLSYDEVKAIMQQKKWTPPFEDREIG